MSIYDQNFEIKTLGGEPFDFSSLKGKRLLLVNTASECGFTPQYKQLQELHETYGGKGFEIVGFPANNFGGQEPGSNAEIATFCEKNYGVSFVMMEKISVKGSNIHPIYKWLTDKELNGVKDMGVQWNFQKFLIDEEGHLVEVYLSNKSPLSEDIIAFAEGKKS
jgi:glutathione peroxidase